MSIQKLCAVFAQKIRKITYSKKFWSSERGNVFFTLFGAVALIGVIGAGTMTLMRGPLSTVVEVNRIEQAKTQITINNRLIATKGTAGAGGACDNDETTEASDPDSSTTPAPTGGGGIPGSIGGALTDPWGTPYGYCTWNHGTDYSTCGNSLAGAEDPADAVFVFAVISAGPDRSFQTTCADHATYLNDVEGAGDDIAQPMTFDGAIAAGGGLWVDLGGGTIQTTDTIDVGGGATFDGVVDLTGTASAQLRLGAASLLMPTQADLGTCNGANNLLMRINTAGSDPVLEICDGPNNAFVPAAQSPWSLTGANPDVTYTAGDVILDAGQALLWGTSGPNISLNAGEITLSTDTQVSGDLDIAGDVVIVGSTNSGTTAVLDVQDSTATSIVYVQHDGNVGIGTTTAVNDKLQVAGSVDVDTSYKIDDAAVLRIAGSATNILAGSGAGANVTGTSNTILGGATAPTLTTGTGNIIIGAAADVSTAAAASELNIGGTIVGDLASDRIGIGYAPANISAFNDTLEVNGNADIAGVLKTDEIAESTTSAGITISNNIVSDVNIIGGDLVVDDNAGTGGDITTNDLISRGNITTDGTVEANDYTYQGNDFTPATCSSGNFNRWSGTAWVCESDTAGGSGSGGASVLNDLDDVTIAAVAGSDCLVYDAVDSRWENISCTTALGGTGGLFERSGTVIRPSVTNGVVLSTDDFVFGSSQLDDLNIGVTDDSRMFFDKSKSAFRAGYTAATSWDDINRGTYSIAFGRNTQASGLSSTAMGIGSIASGEGSIAIGGTFTGLPSLSGPEATGKLSYAWGSAVTAEGDSSIAMGMFDNTQATFPKVSGNRSFAIFMGTGANSQSTVDVTATDTLALLGGRMVIDPAQPSTELAADTHEDAGTLALDVEGYLGAEKYCDQNGNNCFTSTDVTGSGQTIFEVTGGAGSEVVSTIDTSAPYATADFVFGSSQLADTTNADHDRRMFFDKSKGAFRAGFEDSTRWDDASVGSQSVAFGYRSLASGGFSSVLGGALNQATNSFTVAMGNLTEATGLNTTAMGFSVVAEGAGSMAIGLDEDGVSAASPKPKVSGISSLGIFFGDLQDGVDIAANRTMAVMGGRMIIDPAEPATELAADAHEDGGTLTLDVEGYLGAEKYCDQNGNNCFTSTDVSAAATPPGNNTEVIFNDSGAFGADAGFTFNSATNDLTITGDLTVSGDDITMATNTDGFLMVADGTNFNPIAMSGDATIDGTGALTIANDAIEEAMLKAVDAAADEDCLTYETTTGDFEWQDCNAGASSVFEVTGGAGSEVVSTVDANAPYATADFVFGSASLDHDGTNDNRMFFNKGKGSFRAGSDDAARWNDANIGDRSAAFGSKTTASGPETIAWGFGSIASGPRSTAGGYNVIAAGTGSVALGFDVQVTATGDYSAAFGLGDASTANRPQVSGGNSFGIFLGDQQAVDVDASNVMSILGGSVIINPDVTSASPAVPSTAGVGLELHVVGDIGATQYCDQAGANCFVSTDVTGGSSSLSDITAAGANNTIANAAWNQIWNWELTGAETAFKFGESTASTGGSDDQYILSAETLATSTAIPFFINNLGTGRSFQVDDETGDATPFIIDGAGNVSTGGDVTIAGDLTVTGDDITMTTNTDGFLMVADGTNFNPIAMSGDATLAGTGVLTIANNAIEEVMLKAVDTAADEECLTFETTTGDFEWQDCNAGSSSVFEVTGGAGSEVVSTVDASAPYATADFVFGSSQLDDTGNSDHDNRMFFNKSKGAFRAGSVDGTQWDDADVGVNSTAFGLGTRASGQESMAWGNKARATNSYATAWGQSTASGVYSTAFGGLQNVSGNRSIGMALGVFVGLGSAPKITGDEVVAFFMGDQKNVDITTSRVMSLLGGRMIINPDVSSASPAVPSTAGAGLELHVVGDIGATQYCDTVGADCSTPADIAASISDLRLKKNIQTLDNALDKIEKLRGVRYDWRKDEYPDVLRNVQKDTGIGLIAQEIEKIFPEVIYEDSSGFKRVKYEYLVGPLVEATKELSQENITLRAELESLKFDVKTERAEVQDTLKSLIKQVDLLNKTAQGNVNKAGFNTPAWMVLLLLFGMLFGGAMGAFFMQRKQYKRSA